MLLALICLWAGFAAGFVCAALLARRRDQSDTGARGERGELREMRGGFAVERRRLPTHDDVEQSKVTAETSGEER